MTLRWSILSTMLLISFCFCAQVHSSSTLGRRSLSASKRSSASAACTASSSKQLLTNGYFNTDNLDDMHNHLLMMTLSNDVYPWAKQYDIALLDVADGLNKKQLRRFQNMFSEKWRTLGASNIQFLDYYELDFAQAGGAAAHAVVFGTADDVFIAIRGTADMGQVQITGIFDIQPMTIFGVKLQMYHAPYVSFNGLWPKLLPAVKRAVATTNQPSKAKIYVTGHSLGAASSYLAALKLKEQGYRVGGVWGFDPYKAGTTCNAAEDCWVTLYEKHMANVTYSWWNNQDPIPLLVDAHFDTLTPSNASAWGHVPSNGKHWYRIAGHQCLQAEGTDLMDPCPSVVDAADGAADGKCPFAFGDHLPWNILKRVAHCALMQKDEHAQRNSAARLAEKRPSEQLRFNTLACTRTNVWKVLLGLNPPPGYH